eukprot:137797_1
MAQATSEDNNETNNEQNNEQNKQPMNAAQLASLSQLKIQNGALNRYTKELKSYIKELKEQKAKLEDMRNQSNDDEKQDKSKQTEIKKQREAIDETENVIHDIRPKLIKTWETVDGLIQEFNGYSIVKDEDIKLFNTTKEYLEA